MISFETFHKVVEFANGNSSFPERSVLIKVTTLQIGKYSIHGSQVKSLHSAKMHSMPDPWLPVMWIALRVFGVSPRPIKHSLFPMFDPSDVRMNDPLGCCRADQVTNPPKGGSRSRRYGLMAMRRIAVHSQVARAANIRVILLTKSRRYLLIIEHIS